jgi:hypothetical protein
MREFRQYFSVVTRPVTSASEVNERCHGRSPDIVLPTELVRRESCGCADPGGTGRYRL